MKTVNKTKAVKAVVSVVNDETVASESPVSIVREANAIDSMFKRNALGYLEAGKSVEISVDDSVGYVVSKLEAGQSAIRDAILFSAFIFKSKPEEQSKAYAEKLKARWSGSTIPNLISISKALPSFEEKGLSIDKVKDLYALREVSRLIKSEDGHKAVALLNEGMSPRALKKELSEPKAESEGREELKDSPVNFGDEEGKLEALLLSYTDKYSKIAENEARLKIARQIVAKLNLGSYLLMHTEAAAAVKTLKEGKK